MHLKGNNYHKSQSKIFSSVHNGIESFSVIPPLYHVVFYIVEIAASKEIESGTCIVL